MGNLALTEAAQDKPVVLYFEDDELVSKMVCEFLDLEGYQVIHFALLPDSYESLLKNAASTKPVVVILDINMPGINGYQVCEILRSGLIDSSVPIVFSSSLMEMDDILKAYECVGDDYITKPVKLSELKVKLNQQLKIQKEKEGVSQQLDMAKKMAFKAMASSSELGSILNFNERCMQTACRKSIAQELIGMCSQFGLKASVYIWGDQSVYLNDSNKPNTLEQKAMEILRDKPRVYSWDKRTILNFESASLLIRNMPLEDSERYGELKDLVCLLMNGVDARLKALAVEGRAKSQQDRIQKAAESLGDMVLMMEQSKTDLAYQFEKIIELMEQNVAGDLLQFNLLQNEEKVLLDNIHFAMSEAQNIFDQSTQNEIRYRDQLADLLNRLNPTTTELDELIG